MYPNYLNMASMCGKRLKYHRNGFTMLEMTHVGNHIDMWEMAKICGKWLKYLANGLINWEMT